MQTEEYPELSIPNKHEYYKEQIVFFYYFFSRTQHIHIIRERFEDFIQVLKSDMQIKKEEYEPYLFDIYKLTIHTRDQYKGKGEHDISYMIIDILYKYFPDIALASLYQFLYPCYYNQPLGSWRDIKYLCEYTQNDSLINACIEIMNSALSKDILIIGENMTTNIVEIKKKISNLAKWIPRENKRFNWLFEKLVIDWYNKYHPHLLKYCRTNDSYQAALRKCKMKYRTIISSLNKVLDTTEIKLCSQEWNKLNIENIPQIAFEKYKANLCKIIFDSPDKIFDKGFYNEVNMKRLECSLKIKKHLNDKYYPMGEFEPQRPHSKYIPFSIPLPTIIKEAFSLLDKNQEIQVDILNNKWSQLSDIIGNEPLNNMLPIIDMSFHSKQTDSYYSAIGLAILIAERSTFGKRIMVIDNQLSWINLDRETNLFAKIKRIHEETKNRILTTSNHNGVITEFLKYISESQITNKEVKEISLVFFQSSPWNESLHKDTTDLFYDNGIQSPKMIYWNTCQTNNNMLLPGPINGSNYILLSGHNANLISNLSKIKSNNYDTVSAIIKDIKIFTRIR